MVIKARKLVHVLYRFRRVIAVLYDGLKCVDHYVSDFKISLCYLKTLRDVRV
jgi:hypothetical protein